METRTQHSISVTEVHYRLLKGHMMNISSVTGNCSRDRSPRSPPQMRL